MKPDQYLDSLKQFIKSDRPLLALLEETDCNAKNLIDKFKKELPTPYKIIEIETHPDLHSVDIIESLCESLDLTLDTTENHDSLDALINKIQNLAQPSVLIVNNAHNLNEDCLVTIADLAHKQENLMLYTLLVGQIELKEKIKSQGIQIPILLLRTTRAEHPPLRAPANPHKKKFEPVWQKHGVRIMSTVCLVVLAVGFWWHNHSNKKLNVTMHPTPAATVNQPIKNDTAPVFSPGARINAVDNAAPSKPLTVSKAADSAKPENKESTLASNNLEDDDLESIQSSDALPPAAPTFNTQKKTMPVVKTAAKEDPITEKNHVIKKPKLAHSDTHPKVVNATGHYTMQFLASSDLKRAKHFIQNNHLTQASVRAIKKNKTMLYVVTQGQYATLAEAQTAIAHLPKNLKKLGVWARKN